MKRLVRRQRAALAIFIALTVSGVGVAMATPQAGDQPGVTLEVSPTDGQNLPSPATINVAGAGFTANTGILVVQAAMLPNGTTALSNTIGTTTTNSSGGFSTSVNVSQTFTEAGSGQTIDCNAAGVQCSVQAFTTSGDRQSQHTIGFSGGGTTVPTTVVPTTVVPTTVVPTTVVPTTVVPTTVVPTTVVPTTVVPTTVVPTTVVPTTVVPTTVVPTTVVPTTVVPTTVVPTTVLPTTVVPTTVLPTTVVPTTVVPTTVVPTTLGPTTTVGGPVTTVGPAQCAQIRAARAQVNAQIDAARAAILQSGLSPQQAAAALAQLEAIRAQGNAQLNALLAGCPAA